MNKSLQSRGGRIWSAPQVLFSLNLSSAIGFASLVYISRNQASMTPVDDSTYYFLRSAFRVCDFLRLRSVETVSTSTLARQFPSRSSQVGEELVIVLTVAAAATLLVLLAQFAGRTSLYRRAFSTTHLVSALFAAPICYLCVSKLSWNWSREPFSPARVTYWGSLPFLAFLLEVSCLSVLMIPRRKRTLGKRVLIPILLFHYAFWTATLWPEARVWFYPPYAQYLLLLIFPFSAFVWMRSRQEPLQGIPDIGGNQPGMWLWIAAVGAFLVLWAVWSPNNSPQLTRPRDRDSLTVQLSRGPCFGACPNYTITIHGSGQLEYVGRMHTRIQGQRSSSIHPQQVVEILGWTALNSCL